MMFELLQPANLFSSTSVSSEVAGISPDVITLVGPCLHEGNIQSMESDQCRHELDWMELMFACMFLFGCMRVPHRATHTLGVAVRAPEHKTTAKRCKAYTYTPKTTGVRAPTAISRDKTCRKR